MLPADQTKYQVMVVSEVAETHELVNLYLAGSEVRVEGLASVTGGVELVDGKVPDLIILDAGDGGSGGIELCRRIKSDPDLVYLPVLMLSDSVGLKMQSFDVGADEFMIRTVGREDFLIRVNALLRVGSTRRTHAAARMEAETRRREGILNTFRRYVSPALADRIIADADQNNPILGVRNTRIKSTVLFVDMRGFTRISEQLNPGEVVPLLNEYFSLLTEIAFQHEGTVFNMAGDSLMVGFGVPLAQADATVRAAKTARDMLAGFRELSMLWKDRHGIDTGIGVGINEGDVIAGNVGSHAYMSYTIIGDVVNVAARLCQRARSGEMLLSEAVKRSLDEAGFDIGAIRLQPLMLHGRTRPVDIYCVPIEGRITIEPL